MKKIFLLLALSFFILSNNYAIGDSPANPASDEVGPPSPPRSNPVAKKYKDDELLVKFKPDVSTEQKKNVHKKHGSNLLKEFPRLRLHHVKLRNGMSVEEAVKLYKADPSVEYAEPNLLYQTQLTPNDPQYNQLWGMAKINAAAAWNSTIGSQDVVVAIIDTGIDYNHPDLRANMWVNPADNSANGIDNDGDGYVNDIYGISAIKESGDPMDDNGHGTHVAGTIGAVGSNGVGVAGVNWSVKMIGCKFLDSSGSGSTSDALTCLDYVRMLKDRGVNIVATNNSWGGTSYSKALYDAIAAQQDILFVAAAGNDSVNIDSSAHYPAAYNLANVIAVAATDSSDQLSSFSNYGNATVHVGAPGSSIYSTMSAINAFSYTGGYGTLSGTSMATPHVTGLAALLKAQDQTRDASQIKNLIMTGGDSITALAGKTITGRRINAYGSVGTVACANRPLFLPAPIMGKVAAGLPYKLSVLSLNCQSPAGPVTVTTSDGSTIVLTDPAGTGTFTGYWTPTTFPVTLTFSSPAGSQSTTVSSLRVVTYIPEARLDGFYSQALSTTGGSSTASWAITGGTLPTGMSLDPATGIISGTATVAGTYTFTAQATDSAGEKASAQISLVVNGSGWLDEAWGKVFDGESARDDQAQGVAVDEAGNSYVAGRSFNGVTWDVLLLKYGPAGNLLWTRSYDSGEDDIPRSISYDGAGHVYLAGITGDLGNDLLMKYDTSGTLLWNRSFTLGGDGAYGVVTDAAGNFYTVGTMDTGQGDRVLLRKYDPEGNVLWSKSRTTTNAEYGYSLAIDKDGNLLVGGEYIYTYSTARLMYAMIIKFDPAGNVIWGINGGQSSRDTWVNSLAADPAGDVYAVFKGADSEKEVRKYTRDGVFVWQRGVSGVPEAVTTGNGLIYVVGKNEAWVLGSNLLAIDPLGNTAWYQRIDAGVDGSAPAVAAAGAGVTVAGYRANGTDNDIITVHFQPAPAIYDLQATSVSATLSYGTVSYAARVRNNGTGNPAPHVGLFLSKDAMPSADDLNIAFINAPPIPGGTETQLTSAYYLSTTVPCGTYYLTAVANHDKALRETDTTNNAVVGNQLTVTRDLTISAVSGTVSGGNLNYSVTEQNIGNTDAYISTTGVYLSKSPVPSTSDILIATFSGFDKNAYAGRYFPGGGSVTFTGTAPIPSTVEPGAYYITAVADIKNEINETDKSNNARAGNLIMGPDLSLSDFSGSIGDGTVSYSVKVNNTGTVVASPSVALSLIAEAGGGDYPIAMLDAGPISAAGAVTVASYLPLPEKIPAGAYYLKAVADPGNAIAEPDEKNNTATGPHFILGNNPVTLNYTAIGTGGGFVALAPGTVCKGSCSPYYDSGTIITLTASPDAGSVFKGWGGACAGTATCTVVMDQAKSVSAEFASSAAITSVMAGLFYSGVIADGVVWTWGRDYYGELGDGATTPSRYTPAMVDGLAGVTSLFSAAQSSNAFAVKSDGTVWGWGGNQNGQLGDGTTTLRSRPQQVQGVPPVTAVATAAGSTAALGADGTVWAWGVNNYGELGDGTTTPRFRAGQVPSISGVKALAAGSNHFVALREDGTVWTWGDNYYKQLGNGTSTRNSTPSQVPGLSGVVAIASAVYHTLALRADGTVWTWGGNWEGQIGDGTTTDRATPYQVPGVTGVKAIAAGLASSYVLKRDGTVWAWGYNLYGQLGDGTTTNRTAPVQVSGVSGAVGIAAGYYHALVAKDDSTLWGWGYNGTGELGNPTSPYLRVTAIRVPFDTTAPITTASPAEGSYAGPQMVTLAADEAATIYYTTDGSVPTAASTTYSAPIAISGSTTIRFFAKDVAGNVEPVKAQRYVIGTSSAPVADFTASGFAGYAPLTVNFSDLSTATPTSWLWNFGDATTSTLQNPRHVYSTPGSYNVSLTINGPGGSSTKTRNNFVTVGYSGPAAIQPLYNAASPGDVLKVRAGYLLESPVFFRDIVVRIGGGYDFPYQLVVGRTAIDGSIRISNGTVCLSDVTIK